MLIEKIDEYVKGQIRVTPCHSNRASDLGHPCDRYLVFRRLRWEEASPPSLPLQYIFNEGNLHEGAVLRLLQDAGFTIIQQQRDYEWKEYKITAHLDGKLLLDDYNGGDIPRSVPLEVKSMSPFIWVKIHTTADLRDSHMPHLAKYIGQLQTYMLLSNSEEAVLLLKNKSTGQLKELWMELDYEYAESLVQKAVRINGYVDRQEVPPPVPWTESLCGRCPFNAICANEMTRQPLEIVFNEDLEALLKRREELKAAAREYKQVDDLVKAAVTGQEKMVIGGWLIRGKEVTRRGYTVKDTTYWKTDIESLQLTGGAPSDSDG